MTEIPLRINLIAFAILIGVFLGLFISLFLIIKSFRKNVSNLIMGFFMFCLSLVMLEGWLNYTSYIFKALWATNFAEPINFLIAPLLYLFIISQFGRPSKNYWLHLLPFGIWLFYCIFFFLQSDEFKYNSNIEVMQLNYPLIKAVKSISNDPLEIRKYVNHFTGVSFTIYTILIFQLLRRKSLIHNQNLFKTTNKTIKSLRNSVYHFLVILGIFIFVKMVFKDDVGDHLIFLYLTFMFFVTTIQIVNRSDYFHEVSTFLEAPKLKYQKSSLVDKNKKRILQAIVSKMEDDKYFVQSNASLGGLAKAINESSHHVSQVINEKLDKSFFEFLAEYRVEEAKAILRSDIGKNITIEEVAERVGYNSKSAFNAAFKKINAQTPASFRNS